VPHTHQYTHTNTHTHTHTISHTLTYSMHVLDANLITRSCDSSTHFHFFLDPFLCLELKLLPIIIWHLHFGFEYTHTHTHTHTFAFVFAFSSAILIRLSALGAPKTML